jgi:hypothetical protein
MTIRKRRSKAHPGFDTEARKIARRRHIPIKRARAILAAGTRRASAAARRRNPRLNRVRKRKRK